MIPLWFDEWLEFGLGGCSNTQGMIVEDDEATIAVQPSKPKKPIMEPLMVEGDETLSMCTPMIFSPLDTEREWTILLDKLTGQGPDKCPLCKAKLESYDSTIKIVDAGQISRAHISCYAQKKAADEMTKLSNYLSLDCINQGEIPGLSSCLPALISDKAAASSESTRIENEASVKENKTTSTRRKRAPGSPNRSIKPAVLSERKLRENHAETPTKCPGKPGCKTTGAKAKPKRKQRTVTEPQGKQQPLTKMIPLTERGPKSYRPKEHPLAILAEFKCTLDGIEVRQPKTRRNRTGTPNEKSNDKKTRSRGQSRPRFSTRFENEKEQSCAETDTKMIQPQSRPLSRTCAPADAGLGIANATAGSNIRHTLPLEDGSRKKPGFDGAGNTTVPSSDKKPTRDGRGRRAILKSRWPFGKKNPARTKKTLAKETTNAPEARLPQQEKSTDALFDILSDLKIAVPPSNTNKHHDDAPEGPPTPAHRSEVLSRGVCAPDSRRPSATEESGEQQRNEWHTRGPTIESGPDTDTDTDTVVSPTIWYWVNERTPLLSPAAPGHPSEVLSRGGCAVNSRLPSATEATGEQQRNGCTLATTILPSGRMKPRSSVVPRKHRNYKSSWRLVRSAE